MGADARPKATSDGHSLTEAPLPAGRGAGDFPTAPRGVCGSTLDRRHSSHPGKTESADKVTCPRSRGSEKWSREGFESQMLLKF